MPWTRSFDDAGQYGEAYLDLLRHGAGAIDRKEISRAGTLLDEVIGTGRTIFACGNGGSAAVSNHLHCDFLKGIQTGTDRRPSVISLSANIETITAIANDISYADVFVYPLRTMASRGDALIAISASGNSENVIRALGWARENAVRSIALTGFSGGRAAREAEVNIHVPSDNYGVIEDLHQSVMHVLAQFLRQKHMNPAELPGTVF